MPEGMLQSIYLFPSPSPLSHTETETNCWHSTMFLCGENPSTDFLLSHTALIKTTTITTTTTHIIPENDPTYVYLISHDALHFQATNCDVIITPGNKGKRGGGAFLPDTNTMETTHTHTLFWVGQERPRFMQNHCMQTCDWLLHFQLALLLRLCWHWENHHITWQKQQEVKLKKFQKSHEDLRDQSTSESRSFGLVSELCFVWKNWYYFWNWRKGEVSFREKSQHSGANKSEAICSSTQKDLHWLKSHL